MSKARGDCARKRLKARLQQGLANGVRNQSGAAAVLFAVALVLLVPLMLGVFEVYYGSEQRGKLQDALDAAALFAARSTATTTDELTTIGRAALDANLKLQPGAVLKSASFVVQGQKIVATAKLAPASLMAPASSLWHHPDITVTTEVNRAMDKLEIALVLDNTGSMAGTKLSTLKTAANNLIDTLSAASATSTETEPLKVSLVPFSNTVRVQSTTSLATYNTATHSGAGVPSWIDPQGKSHQVAGVNLDGFSAANVDRLALMKYMKAKGTNVQIPWEGCVEARPQPYDVQDDAPTTATPGTMYVPYFWPDEADNGVFKPTGSSTTYNSSSNDYINDTPAWSSTEAYLTGDMVTFTPPAWSSSTTYAKDAVVTYNSAYWRATGVTVNKNKTPSSSSTYWVTDTGAARAIADNTNKTPASNPTYWATDTNRDPKARQLNRAKYGSTVSGLTLKNSGNTSLGTGYPYGPNAGCYLQPLVRLTTTMSTVKTAINAMTAVGETHIPIGLAWGWNTLSPFGPYADGKAYSTEHVRKIVILMTDGENTMSDPSGAVEPNGSIYGGFAFIWQKMLGLTSSATTSQRTAAIDARLAQLCTNMKSKGITIYTVRVEVTSGSSSLLQNCATTPDKFYDVQQVSQLNDAFAAIARSIDNLRISK